MPLHYRRVTDRYPRESFTQVEQLMGREWRCGVAITFAPAGAWRPFADIYETASDLIVKVELAGVREEDIEVTLFEDMLLVAGRREPDHGDGHPLRFYEAAIRFGSFHAEVGLPMPIDRGRVVARLDRGMLQVTLPKLQAVERRAQTRG